MARKKHDDDDADDKNHYGFDSLREETSRRGQNVVIAVQNKTPDVNEVL